MKTLLTTILFFATSVFAMQLQAQNFGIGTGAPSSKLSVNGSFEAVYTNISTTPYNVGANDFYVAYNGTANGTFNLPAAVSGTNNFGGRVYHFKNTSASSNLVIAANGAELIDNRTDVASITLLPGYYCKIISKGTTTGSTWEIALIANNNSSVAYEAIGTSSVTVAQGITADIPGATITFNTVGPSTTLLITYGAIGLPAGANAPVQGTIDLVIDGTKSISSYYSACDAPGNTLVRLGNYSTAQKLITVAAGSHTVKLQAKSWANTTVFNTDPVTVPYVGAISSDANAMKARISVLVTAN